MTSVCFHEQRKLQNVLTFHRVFSAAAPGFNWGENNGKFKKHSNKNCSNRGLDSRRMSSSFKHISIMTENTNG